MDRRGHGPFHANPLSVVLSYLQELQVSHTANRRVLVSLRWNLDIGTKRPMDRYLNHDLVLVKSMNVSSSYTNALMMVSVRNPFMKQCMSALELHSHSYELVGKHLHVEATNIYMYISSVFRVSTLFLLMATNVLAMHAVQCRAVWQPTVARTKRQHLTGTPHCRRRA